MSDTALFEEDTLAEGEALEAGDLEAGADAYGDDAFDELDELAEAGDVEGLDALEELDAAEGLADEFEESLGDEFAEEDSADAFGDYAVDDATGLYLPRRQLITGPAAVAIARRLNPFVLEAMSADDADAFFRRIGRGLRRIGRGVGRVAGRVGRVVGRVARAAAPLLQRALPIIQRVAGIAGPWGRLVSAGIGAARGLIAGRGLRGALAGAVGGLIPGVGGQIARSVLGGDGADDDAALDALADMADARQVPAAVALPLGAGLAARVVTPRPAGAIPPPVARCARAAERTMLRAGAAAGGSTGRRLRVMRTVARVARARVAQAGGPVAAARAVPAATAAAARRVVAQVRRRPAAGVGSPAVARRRLAVRRRILATVPLGAAVPRLGPLMTI
jgi:hypothetical protein